MMGFLWARLADFLFSKASAFFLGRCSFPLALRDPFSVGAVGLFVAITGKGCNAFNETSLWLCLKLENRLQVYLYFSHGKRLEAGG